LDAAILERQRQAGRHLTPIHDDATLDAPGLLDLELDVAARNDTLGERLSPTPALGEDDVATLLQALEAELAVHVGHDRALLVQLPAGLLSITPARAGLAVGHASIDDERIVHGTLHRGHGPGDHEVGGHDLDVELPPLALGQLD